MKLSVTVLVVLLCAGVAFAQSSQPSGNPKPTPDSFDLEKARKESPRIKADTRGNVEKLPPRGAAKDSAKVTPPPAPPQIVPFKSTGDTVTTETGLRYIDVVVGKGDVADSGKMVEVHYTGWFSENGKRGKKFDSSVDRNAPLAFMLGRRIVIAAWEQGIKGMKVGGKRTLIVKPELGYGASGFRDIIPPNQPLIFDIEFLAIKKL